MPLIMPGEMHATDVEVIDPGKIVKLRSHLQERLAGVRILDYRVRLTTSDDASPTYDIGLTGEPAALLDEITGRYYDLLASSVVDFKGHEHWLILGLGWRNIPWHIDTPGDVRCMLNAGEDQTYVDVATLWDPSQYSPGDPNGRSPEAYETLSVESGQMYASNALATNRAVLRPHETPVDAGRLVLRTSLYAADGWQALAVGDGVPVQLGVL